MSLPAELHSLVLEQLWDRRGRTVVDELENTCSFVADLCALSLSSRAWTRAAQSQLERLVVLSACSRSAARLCVLSASPGCASKVETVLWDHRPAPRGEVPWNALRGFARVCQLREWIGRWPMSAGIGAASALLRVFPTLLRAHVMDFADLELVDCRLRDIVVDRWDGNVGYMLATTARPSVRSMSICATDTMETDIGNDLAAIVTMLPSLDRLHLSSIYVDELAQMLSDLSIASLRQLRLRIDRRNEGILSSAVASAAAAANLRDATERIGTLLKSVTLGTALGEDNGEGDEALLVEQYLAFAEALAQACRRRPASRPALGVHLRPSRKIFAGIDDRCRSLVSTLEAAGARCTLCYGPYRVHEVHLTLAED